MANFVDPQVPDFCERKDCFPCRTADKPTRGMCWREGAAYRIDCLLCQPWGITAVYHGETGSSSYWRGKFHLEGLLNRKPDSALYQHLLNFHPSRHPSMRDFRMHTAAVYKRPIVRQSREGLEINSAIRDRQQGKKIVLLNSRNDFHQPGVVRTSYTSTLS